MNMADQFTLEQSLREIFPTLPTPVQRFIKDGKPGEAAQTIMDHYVLHIDQGAIIEHQILLALFGVVGPEEFMETLSNKLSVSDEVVGGIIEDVNKEVFIPLREEMRKGGGKVEQHAPAPGLPKLGSTATPSGTPPSHFHLQNKIAPPSRPAQPPSRPMDNRKLLEDHEEPHIEFKKMPPPNLPGAIYHPPIPKPSVPPRILTPSTPLKSHPADPYREPIDEK